MRQRCFQLTKKLQSFDPKLFASVVVVTRRNPNWVENSDLERTIKTEQIHVFERATRCESIWLNDDTQIHVLKPYGNFVFALTDNWNAKGNPVDWGLEPIMSRLRSINIQARADFFTKLEEEEEKARQSEERARKNKLEDFLHEFHLPLRKASEGINTSLIQSDKKFQRKFEKRIHRS